MMVGRKVNLVVQKEPVNRGEPVLRLEHLHVKDNSTGKYKVNDVSFTVNAGEIVCIAGVDGNGQTELAEAITGLLPVESGKIYLDGKDVTGQTVRYRNANGVSHIPEDRQKRGLVLDYNIAREPRAERLFHRAFSNPRVARFQPYLQLRLRDGGKSMTYAPLR